MSEEILKVKYKFGNIEFEAEGPSSEVEKQRSSFMNSFLPLATEVISQAQLIPDNRAYPLDDRKGSIVEIEKPVDHSMTQTVEEYDYSRISLSSFLGQYGDLTEQDFILFSANYCEKKTGNRDFSIENIREWYSEARRPVPKNPSSSLFNLAQKGLIMDSDSTDLNLKGKCYIVSNAGFDYIRNYAPRESKNEKKPRQRVKKANGIQSQYAETDIDKVDMSKYPVVKMLNKTKQKVVLAMYIFEKEELGDWFSVNDIDYILEHYFGVSLSEDSIEGVFRNDKHYFIAEQDPTNKRANRYKLRSVAKDYVESLIQDSV